MHINVHRNVPRQFSRRTWRMDSSRDTEEPRSGSDDRHLGSMVVPHPVTDTECWLHPLFSSFLPTREAWVLGLDVWVWALSPFLHMVGRTCGNECSRNQLWWIYSSLHQSNAWNWYRHPDVKFSNLFQSSPWLVETVPTYIDKTLFRPHMSSEIHVKAILYYRTQLRDCTQLLGYCFAHMSSQNVCESISISRNIHCVSIKNTSDIFRCNSSRRCRILIIFGTNV